MRTQYTNCPLCKSPKLHSLREVDCSKHDMWVPGIPETIHWMRCGDCAHVFTSHYWTKAGLDLLLAKTYAEQTPGIGVESQRPTSARIIEKVIEQGSHCGSWLDVGFGNGSLLLTANEYGIPAFGIDIRPDSVAALRRLGIKCDCCEIADIKEDNRFSCISFCDVLEHMPDPKAALVKAFNLLKLRGTLFVSMPNMDAPVWSYLDAQGENPYWTELEHLHNFGRRRMLALLTEVGFSHVRYGISQRYRACMELTAIK